MNLLETLDSSHILDKISKIPPGLITEIIIIILVINFVASVGYYRLYLNNSESFKNIHHQEKPNEKSIAKPIAKPNEKPIEYFDFVYYANTLFFSLGYDIVPQTKCAKLFTIIHMKLGFIITTIFIAKIVSSC